MNGRTLRVFGSLGMLFLLSALSFIPIASAATPYSSGDVFAGVGNGAVTEWTPTGTLVNTLQTTSGSSEETGMCFDASGNLFVTNFEAMTISKFDSSGNLVAAAWYTFPGSPESCVVDNSGNIYVGGGGLNQIYEFTDSGTSGSLVNSWTVAVNRGSDWIALAANQCTMYYTSESATIYSFDVCTGTQGPNFATMPSSPCFALNIRTNGELMVACSSNVYLLDSSGTVLQTYPIPADSSGDFLFALNLDPDGTSFWTAGYYQGNIYRIDIASGNILSEFNAPHYISVAGLAVFGQINVGCPSCSSTTTTTTTTQNQGVPQFGAGSLSTIFIAAAGLVGLSLVMRMKKSSPLPKPMP